MELKVTTKQSGEDKILVKGRGRQKTYAYDTAANVNENHGWRTRDFVREVLDIPKDSIDWGRTYAEPGPVAMSTVFHIATLD